MQDKAKIELFETMPLSRAIAKLAVPTVMSSLVMVLYNLADTYFVGLLNDPAQTAAVTLAGPVLLAFNAVNNLFGVGTSSMMSRALGRRDEDTVIRSSAFGFWCAAMGAVLFSVLCTVFRGPLMVLLGTEADTLADTERYMFWTVTCGALPAILNVVMAYLVRSEGAALHASIGTMSGCALNIVLDPVFILPWGFDMGAAGAGCATFLSNCFACCYFAVLLYKKRGKTMVCVDPRKFCLRRDIVLGVFGVGLPASIQNLLNVTGMTILNNFAAVFGADAVAAMGIAHKVVMIPMQVTFGTSQGIMPLVSYNYASGNIKRMKAAVVSTGKLISSALIVAAAALWVFSGGVIRLFMSNPSVVSYGSAFLRAQSISLPLMAIDFLAVGVFQAVGMGQYSLLFAVLRKIVLEIPALFILNKLFPLFGLAWAQTVSEAVLAMAAVIMLIRLFRRFEAERQAAPVQY